MGPKLLHSLFNNNRFSATYGNPLPLPIAKDLGHYAKFSTGDGAAGRQFGELGHTLAIIIPRIPGPLWPGVTTTGLQLWIK